MSTPAGWHPCPWARETTQRYWDGSEWTSHTAPRSTQPQRDETFDISNPVSEQPTQIASETVVSPRERRRQEKRVATLSKEVETLEAQVAQLRLQLVEVGDVVQLQEVGLYADHDHPAASSFQFKDELARLRAAQKDAVRGQRAIAVGTSYTLNGSEAQGRKMVADYAKLMLRAYNNEADNAVRKVKPSNYRQTADRLVRIANTVARLGKALGLSITSEYHELRIRELRLTCDFQAAKEAEKEADRAHKEDLREQAKLEKEIARERAKAEKERSHYERVVAALEASGEDAEALADARRQLAAIDDNLDGLDFRQANTRAGYVYVISNRGAFGPDVVKIGMTRRLNPEDRVRELGDASVPYRFDTHAMIFAEDAVGLEVALHKQFGASRLNLVNMRREFFRTTPAAVRSALRNMPDYSSTVVEFDDSAQAHEFVESEQLRPPLDRPATSTGSPAKMGTPPGQASLP